MEGDPVTFRVLMEDDSEHLRPCSTCGELIDDRDLAALLRHRRAPHSGAAPALAPDDRGRARVFG
ncbi:MAG: hypothetical protein AB7T59_02910 [Hyphomonadaceae bacterium]